MPSEQYKESHVGQGIADCSGYSTPEGNSREYISGNGGTVSTDVFDIATCIGYERGIAESIGNEDGIGCGSGYLIGSGSGLEDGSGYSHHHIE